MEEARHTLTLDKREKLTLTGVEDILSYDDETILAKTNEGILIIKGTNLHIGSLDLDKGTFTAFGDISALDYDNEPSSKSSLLGRIFR